MDIVIIRQDVIDSTNAEALRQARRGADEGTCIIARQQTAGRGRRGRKWISEKDAGLYFSIVLRPRIDMSDLPLITLTAGIAVHDTLRDLGLKPDIKWVNDILVCEKKISGILAETTDTDRGLAVILGIGINLRFANFAPEIADIATSLEAELTDAGRIDANELAASLVRYLVYFYEILHSEGGNAKVIDDWRRRSSYYSGKRVTVHIDGENVQGVTEGLEQNGALRLRMDDGALQIVQAGDVERVRPNRTINRV